MGRETKKGLVVEVTISGTLVSTSRYRPTGKFLAAETLLSGEFPLSLKIPPFSYSPCPGHRLTRRMQRSTNQFVSRCSPFPYCELDSFFASSLAGAFFVGKGKLFRCFPNPLFSLWLSLLTSWCKRAQENLCTVGIDLFHPRFLFCNSLFTSSLQKVKSRESKANLRRILFFGT